MDNKKISEKTGLDSSEITRIFNRKKYGRGISWRQATLLDRAFGMGVDWWLTATEKQIKRLIGRG